MLITAENDLERTIEIYILTIDIRCAIIRLELADACLDHADAHHKTGIPLDNGLKVIVTFQNHFGKQLRKRMIQIIPLRTAEVKQYRNRYSHARMPCGAYRQSYRNPDDWL